jgi:MFS family permease
VAQGPRGSAGAEARTAAAADGRAKKPRPGLSARAGFWTVAAGFALLMALGTAPTPLWPRYAALDRFGASTITEVFAVLVGGAAFGLLALGHLSDRVGRRPVALCALAVAVAAALVLAFWNSVPGLVTGRLLNGLAIGLMAATATAYLTDLHRLWRPDRPRAALPAVVATAANLGGLALGPLAAGAIAQWVPRPLLVTQLAFAAALALCLPPTAAAPETVHRERADGRTARRRFAVRSGAGGRFAAASALGFLSFALFGVVTSLGAVVLRDDLAVSSPLVAGVAPFLMFAAAAAGQLALAEVGADRLLALGAWVLPAGLALVVVSLYEPRLWLYLPAVTVAGAGAGVLFKGGVAAAGAAAEPDARAGTLAVYFAASYLGLGLPSIAFGQAIKHADTAVVMLVFAVVLSAGVAAAVLALRRSPSG